MIKKKALLQVSLKLILKNKEGRILGLKSQLDDAACFGLYDLPGGRIDEDELQTPLLEIIQREAMEEIGNTNFKIGLKPVSVNKYFFRSDKTVVYLFFDGEYFGNDKDIKVSEEHTGYKWIDPKQGNLGEIFCPLIKEGILLYFQNS